VRVRASSGHFDIFARLCDVDPKGRSRNVCDGLIRLRPEDERDEGAADGSGPGASRVITVAMSSTAHRFHAGHRLRLQVSGGAHPRFARNTGSGEPPATATRLVAVDVHVAHGGDQASWLSLPVQPAAADL
jgi:putative CocE/NonD family hydrolase